MFEKFPLRPIGKPIFWLVVLLVAGLLLQNAAVAGKTSVTVSGSVVAIRPGAIIMQTESKKTLVVRADPEKANRVSIKGPVDPATLRPGMLVRYHGTLKKSNVEGEIAQVTVFSPADGYVPSILDDDGRTMITGAFKALRRGKLVIEIGRRTISAQLADDATIEINSTDYRMILPGDQIKVSGRPRRDQSITPRYVRVTRPAIEMDRKKATGVSRKK